MKFVTDIEMGRTKQEDGYEMKKGDSEKYIVDILSSDGNNLRNINAGRNRGTGIVTQILTKLEDICFGRHFFKVAIILRNSHLISSLLTNAEVHFFHFSNLWKTRQRPTHTERL